MPPRETIAIDIDRRWLRAVGADRNGRAVVIRQMVAEAVPAGVNGEDPDALGAWIRSCLDGARMPRGHAVLAIAREHVALKRLALPTANEAELPEMTRLALSRELPFDPASAVIDFVPLEHGEHSTTVLAAAAPTDVLEFTRRVARAAGLGVERISLRTMGSAALLGGLPLPDGGATLAVDVTSQRVEFSVIADGTIRFSRASDLPAQADPDEIAAAVITETRRTWMSYRMVDDAVHVRRAVVFGEAPIAGRAAGEIGEILKVPTDVLRDHPMVDGGGHDLAGAWPLAGLLLEPALERDTIDFGNPRKAPDTAGRKRQLITAALGLLLVAALVVATLARFRLSDLEGELEGLDAQRRELYPQISRYARDRYKLEHLRRWSGADADWMAHLAHIVELAPPPDQLVLDRVTGTMRFGGVEFDRREKTWSAPMEVRIVLEGEAADRATADAFRGALVATEAYEITTSGPDTGGGKRLPYAFTYLLRTTLPAPPGSAPADQAVAARPNREAGP